ncbi:MAG: sodium-dependent transporter [Bacteroidia bacterium]|nr:MAG: sodium-dependent transporter [Bacteroidia bacterium]
MEKAKRESFGSRFGIIAATAGAAVGLGNIWKFPFETGENGGSAFILLYILFVIILGLPVMVTEFTIGRHGQSDATGSFKRIAPGTGWSRLGYLSILTSFIIICFYSTVAGWTLEYTFNAFRIVSSDAQPGEYFGEFISNPYRPVIWQATILLLTALIVLRGVTKGIERFSKLLMPLLLVLVLIICIRSLMLNGASAGLEFLFSPDFSKITPAVVLSACGQAFFSLSIGNGGVLTYGSYVSKDVNMVSTSLQVSMADTIVAILAGVMIFPAVFAFGVEPAAGPSLVYITLPQVFASMHLGQIWGLIFFLLLTLAALTSMINLLEVTTLFFVDHVRLSRPAAVLTTVLLVALVGIPATLSMGVLSGARLFGKSFFDLLDFTASNLLMPLGGLLMVIFVAWGPGQRMFAEEVTNRGTINATWLRVFQVLLKYIVPLLIALILIAGLI